MKRLNLLFISALSVISAHAVSYQDQNHSMNSYSQMTQKPQTVITPSARGFPVDQGVLNDS